MTHLSDRKEDVSILEMSLLSFEFQTIEVQFNQRWTLIPKFLWIKVVYCTQIFEEIKTVHLKQKSDKEGVSERTVLIPYWRYWSSHFRYTWDSNKYIFLLEYSNGRDLPEKNAMNSDSSKCNLCIEVLDYLSKKQNYKV